MTKMQLLDDETLFIPPGHYEIKITLAVPVDFDSSDTFIRTSELNRVTFKPMQVDVTVLLEVEFSDLQASKLRELVLNHVINDVTIERVEIDASLLEPQEENYCVQRLKDLGVV